MLLLRINEEAESFYKQSEALGQLAAQAFLEERKGDRQRKHRAQMTGLENIAETMLKVSDVLDYIKKQIARQPGWVKEYNGQQFGESLKNFIEKDFAKNVQRICKKVGNENQSEEEQRERQYIYLQLIRQCIRQLVVHYEYRIGPSEGVAS